MPAKREINLAGKAIVAIIATVITLLLLSWFAIAYVYHRTFGAFKGK